MAQRKVTGLGILLFSVAGLSASSALADIGGVGAPAYEPPSRNVLPAYNAPMPAAGFRPALPMPAAPASHKPLLVIRFNQPHIYYQHSLQQAVAMTAKVRPGAVYEVVSIIPPNSHTMGNEHIHANAERNLQEVVHSLQGMGVADGQIHTATQTSDSATMQEIQIFVN